MISSTHPSTQLASSPILCCQGFPSQLTHSRQPRTLGQWDQVNLGSCLSQLSKHWSHGSMPTGILHGWLVLRLTQSTVNLTYFLKNDKVFSEIAYSPWSYVDVISVDTGCYENTVGMLHMELCNDFCKISIHSFIQEQRKFLVHQY